MNTAKKAIVLHTTDNVATALNDLCSGETLTDLAVGGNRLTIELKDDIPFGHKFSLYKIDVNSKIIKYGEIIGVATQEINVGEHVHVQNVVSTRGRGGLVK